MKKLTYLISALFCFGFRPILAQIVVTTYIADIPVHPSGNTQAEVHISIDKSNPNYLILSTNLGYPSVQASCSSMDGGLTWVANPNFFNATGTGTNEIVGDPSTAIGANGYMYISTMYSVKNMRTGKYQTDDYS